SIGASLNVFGYWVGSVMTVAPSSLPISELLGFAASAGLAAAAGAVVATGAAGFAASAGFAVAAGAVVAAGAAGLAASVGFAASAGLVSAGLVAGAAGAQAASRLTPTTPRLARRNDLRERSCCVVITTNLRHWSTG